MKIYLYSNAYILYNCYTKCLIYIDDKFILMTNYVKKFFTQEDTMTLMLTNHESHIKKGHRTCEISTQFQKLPNVHKLDIYLLIWLITHNLVSSLKLRNLN